MKLTPLDIQQHQFRRELRGYDRREVHAFLELVSQELAEAKRDENELRAEVKRLVRENEEHKGREATLKEAMLTAQRAIEEIRENAQKEAQVVVSEAEVRSERILHNAHSRVTKILEEITDLRRQRTRAMAELRGVLNTHVRLLDVHEETAQHDQGEGSVTVLERLRAPSPPDLAELGLVDASG